MNIESVVVGPFEVNCYIVWNQANQAIIIDPGGEADKIADFLHRHKLCVAVYLITHGHIDHVSGLADLHDRLPAPIGIHADDLAWAFGSANHMQPYYDVPRRPAEIKRTLQDGQTWRDSGLDYAIIATPGHSPGGVCFHFPTEAVLFTGDTLFQNSVGRTDLPGGNGRVLAQSLKKLAPLPPKTRVFPGHGPETSIESELKYNIFMKGQVEI